MKFLSRYIFIPVILIVFIYFSFSVYREVKTKTINQFNAEQLLVAKSAAQGITDYFGNLQTELTFFSSFPEIIDFNDNGAELSSKFYKNYASQIEAVTRISSEGTILYTYPENNEVIGSDISYQKHFSEVIKEQKPVISDVFMALQGYLAIAVHVPIFKDNEFHGSLAVLIAIDKIGKRYLENIKFGDSGYALLLSENNIEIFCPFHTHISKSIVDISQNDPSVLILIDQIKKNDFGTVNCFHDANENATKTEKNVNFYRIPLGNTYWTILISNPQSEITKTVAGFRNRLVTLFIVLLIILLIYFYFFVKAKKVIKAENNRKIAEKALSESEEKYRLLHEAAGVGIGYYSPEGIVISYNKIAAENMNGKPEDFAGKSIFDLFPKDIATFYFERIKKASISKIPQEYEDEVELPKGNVWFSSVYSKITDSNKKIVGIQIISTEITQRKKAEQIEQNLYNQLNRIAANIPGAIYEYCLKPDGTSYIPYASEGFEKIYGLKNDVIKNDASPVFNLIHPDDIEEFTKSITNSAENITPWFNENRILLPSGEIKWVEGKSTPHKLEDGTILWQGYISDITERKEMENLLVESERRYRELFENMNTGFVLFEVVQDEKGKPIDLIINTANKEFENTTGLDLKQVSGKRLTLELPGIENDPANWIGTYGEIAINGGTKQFEDFSENLGYYYSVYAYQFAQNKCAVSFLDITERKRAEEERQKFVMLANSSSEFIGMCDLELNPLYVNPAGIQMVGLSDIEAACNVKVQDYFFAEDQKFIAEDFFPQVLRDGHGSIEIRLKHFQTNKAIWVLYYLFHLRDTKGKIVGWATVSRDITESKNAEKALNKSEERLRLSTEQANVAVWEYDYKTKTMLRSNNHDKLYGVEAQENWDGQIIINAVHPEDRENIQVSMHNSIAIGGPDNFKLDFRVIYPDQSIHWLVIIGQVVERNDKGEGIIVRGTITDITEFKLAEAEINKLNEDLEKRVTDRTEELSNSQLALLNLVEDLHEKTKQLEISSKKLEAKNKELETFTYSVSHDLKAPLRGIDGYSSLLEELYSDKLEGEGLEFIKTIRRGTNQMNQLIEDLLAYSRFERTVLRTTSFNIKDLIKNLLNHQKNHISGKNVSVELLVEDCEIQADYNGVSIALRNLIENAFKFSTNVPSPRIKIILKDNVSSWQFIVEDNGIGFDMKYKNKIYEIFHRLNLPEQFPGTGIGLALVAKSANRMGGKISAESKPGKGAKFYFEIPKNTTI